MTTAPRSSDLEGPVGHAPPTGLSDSTAWPVSALSRLRDGIGDWGSVGDGQLGHAFRVTSTCAEGTCRPARAGVGGKGRFEGWQGIAFHLRYFDGFSRGLILVGVGDGDFLMQIIMKQAIDGGFLEQAEAQNL